jgi:hypothetical protein
MKEFAFEIVTTARTFIVSAYSQQDMDQWVACIKKASGV